MSNVLAEIRSGAYYDSVVLMQLQRALVELPGVEDAGVVMGTPANKELLEQSGLCTPQVEAARPDDLVVVVRAVDEAAARAALAQIDHLLARRRSRETSMGYRPRTLEGAAKLLPEAQWVLVSVPGRYAAGVADQALDLGKHVFLYSDNVPLEEEIRLKNRAVEAGLLVMGPDCGTALVRGVGLGFANGVRRGPVGVVAAAGTGLQTVACAVHRLGGGLSHGLGTGGRDLSDPVGGLTARQGLAILAQDPDTRVIVLISKPPSPRIAGEILAVARDTGKPVVVHFVGLDPAQLASRFPGIHVAPTLDEAARMALEQAGMAAPPEAQERDPARERLAAALAKAQPEQRYLRGLYSGGTLASEALALLRGYLAPLYSNVPLPGGMALESPHHSQAHTVVDLGADEFTVGRLHPMLDNELRVRRLLDEAQDPEVAAILLDVVLGYGAHPDPAGELAPAIRRARDRAGQEGRALAVVAVVIGTDRDPQELDGQVARLQEAGAVVFHRHDRAVQAIGSLLAGRGQGAVSPSHPAEAWEPRSDASSSTASGPVPDLSQPVAAINVGLEIFAETLQAQGASVVHVDWRPPAGGDQRLMGILARMSGSRG